MGRGILWGNNELTIVPPEESSQRPSSDQGHSGLGRILMWEMILSIMKSGRASFLLDHHASRGILSGLIMGTGSPRRGPDYHVGFEMHYSVMKSGQASYLLDHHASCGTRSSSPSGQGHPDIARGGM